MEKNGRAALSGLPRRYVLQPGQDKHGEKRLPEPNPGARSSNESYAILSDIRVDSHGRFPEWLLLCLKSKSRHPAHQMPAGGYYRAGRRDDHTERLGRRTQLPIRMEKNFLQR